MATERRKPLLAEYVNKHISIITNDGRTLIGRLRGLDQVCNIIVDQCVERVFASDAGVTNVSHGLLVVRGDNL